MIGGGGALLRFRTVGRTKNVLKKGNYEIVALNLVVMGASVSSYIMKAGISF
jgi:hypothetical protein